jgi:hypothetical protein
MDDMKGLSSSRGVPLRMGTVPHLKEPTLGDSCLQQMAKATISCFLFYQTR